MIAFTVTVTRCAIHCPVVDLRLVGDFDSGYVLVTFVTLHAFSWTFVTVTLLIDLRYARYLDCSVDLRYVTRYVVALARFVTRTLLRVLPLLFARILRCVVDCVGVHVVACRITLLVSTFYRTARCTVVHARLRLPHPAQLHARCRILRWTAVALRALRLRLVYFTLRYALRFAVCTTLHTLVYTRLLLVGCARLD